MTVIGYVLFTLALVSYGATVKAIWTLVGESKRVESEKRFNRFWWLPAWRIHRKVYPDSSLRRQIVTRFALTFALVVISTTCVGAGMFQRGIASR